MVRRWLEVDKVATKNECNAILQYFIRLFEETINLSLSIDTLLLVKELRLCCLLFAKSEFCDTQVPVPTTIVWNFYIKFRFLIRNRPPLG